MTPMDPATYHRRLLIRGARVIDPATGRDEVADLFVRDGILELPPADPPPGTHVVEAGGLVAAPGFVDVHVHLREPGDEESETIASGAATALRGGFTAVAAMANTDPVNDDPGVTAFVLERAAAAGGLVEVIPVSAVTKGLAGRELVDFEAQRRAGAGAFSDDGMPVEDDATMLGAMERAAALGARVHSHAEDRTRAAGGAIRAGEIQQALGVRGVPADAETLMVARDVALAERSGAPIHICHVSTVGSIRVIREARARGVPVTAETAPHYFSLTVDALAGGDPHFKMNPPLGDAEDRHEVIRALREGVFDAIASDHAPHAAHKKRGRSLQDAAFGIVGLETMLPVTHSHLVATGELSLIDALRLLTSGPASVLGRNDLGRLLPGVRAAINLLDLQTPWRFAADRMASRSRNCPFDGWTVTGRVVRSIVGGSVVEHP